jgi:hypothetical protein
MQEVKAIRLCLPMETFKLLQTAASQAGVSEELFAQICISSVICRHAKEIIPVSQKPDPASDDSDKPVLGPDAPGHEV